MKQNGLFQSDIKRIISSPVFWSAVAISVICMIINLCTYQEFLGQYLIVGTLNRFYFGAIFAAGGVMAPLVPILPVLAFGTSIYDDVESGYIRQILTRMKRSTYLMQRMASVAIAGGSVFVISMILFWLFLPLFDSNQSPMIEYSPIQGAFGNVYNYSMFAYFVLYIFVIALFGSLQALLSTGVSLLAHNRYIGLIVPAILFHGGRLIYSLTGYRFSVLPWYSYSLPLKGTAGAVTYEFVFYLILCMGTIAFGWKRVKKRGIL